MRFVIIIQVKQLVGEKIGASKRILLDTLLITLICTVPGISLLILLPSAIFWLVENNWTYLDCIYYAFFNMTHIGFGNLINIRRDQAVASKLGLWMWAYRLVKQKLTPIVGITYFVNHRKNLLVKTGEI